jgi:hypothetical protein
MYGWLHIIFKKEVLTHLQLLVAMCPGIFDLRANKSWRPSE